MSKHIYKLAIMVTLLLGFAQTSLAQVNTKIRVGHVINITVLEHSELSQAVRVREDGTTTYPLLTGIPIDGMTLGELSALLTPIFTRFVERPVFFVNISDFLMLNVRVLGQVLNVGPHNVQGPLTIQGVLAAAGGVLPEADLRKVRVFRRSDSGLVEHVINVMDLFAVERSSEDELPEIEDGDMIIVPILDKSSYVQVLGKVEVPGNYIPAFNETILDVIYRAGGEKSIEYAFYASAKGDLTNVMHFTMTDGNYTRTLYDLKQSINDGMTNSLPVVKPGDLVVVGSVPSYKTLTFWSLLIRDIGVAFSTYLIVSNI